VEKLTLKELQKAYREMKDGEAIMANGDMFAGTESLVRGMMCMDLNCIRGKRYFWLIQDLTGISLYAETINTLHLRQIAESLEDLVLTMRKHNNFVYEKTNPSFDIDEIEVLARWFRICADNGYWVEGYW